MIHSQGCGTNLGVVAPEELRMIAGLLKEAGYCVEGLAEVLGSINVPVQFDASLPYLLYLTRRGRPIDILVRWFLIGIPVPKSSAVDLFGLPALSLLIGSGLLEEKEGSLAGLVKLLPFGDLLIAVDQPTRPEIADLPEQVMGFTRSTYELAGITIRRPSRRTLDLGTGSGVQAFLCSAHSEEVYAVDRNPRVLRFARFNAGLNDRSNVRFLDGDAFEPVGDHPFDLIVSNPPFAVSPHVRYVYRDSGHPGDDFCRNIIRRAPAFLAAGGYCQITCDWIQLAGQDWRERLSSWFLDAACDAWVLRSEVHDPGEYVYAWVRDTEYGSFETSRQRYDEWVSYLERGGVEGIGSGVIVIRKTGGPTWIELEDAPTAIWGPIGNYVERVFDLHDFLRRCAKDEDLVVQHLCVAPELRLEQSRKFYAGNWENERSIVRLSAGLGYRGNIGRNELALLSRCDGRHAMIDILKTLAVEFGVEIERIIPSCLALVRQMVLHGYLLPVGGDSGLQR